MNPRICFLPCELALSTKVAFTILLLAVAGWVSQQILIEHLMLGTFIGTVDK